MSAESAHYKLETEAEAVAVAELSAQGFEVSTKPTPLENWSLTLITTTSAYTS